MAVPLEIFVFLLIFIAGIARVIAGIGGALIVQTIWMLSWHVGLGTGSMKDAAALVICFQFSAIVQGWLLRREINFRLVASAGIPWTCLEILGTRILIEQDRSPWLKRSFGIVLFFILILEAYTERQKQTQCANSMKLATPEKPAEKADAAAVCLGSITDVVDIQDEEVQDDQEAAVVYLANASGAAELQDEQAEDSHSCNGVSDAERTRHSDLTPLEACTEACEERFDMSKHRNLAWALFLGVGGGLMAGLFTVPLPMLSLFVLCSGIRKDEWRANGVLIQLISLPSKCYYFFVIKAQYDGKLLSVYLTAMLASMLAVWFGNKLAAHVSQDGFKRFVRAMTFMGACSMSLAGTFLATWSAFGAAMVSIILLICVR